MGRREGTRASTRHFPPITTTTNTHTHTHTHALDHLCHALVTADRNFYEEAIKLFRGSRRWHQATTTGGGAITGSSNFLPLPGGLQREAENYTLLERVVADVCRGYRSRQPLSKLLLSRNFSL